MPQTRGFQIVALQNIDRLLLKSMLGMLEQNLSAHWVETALAPTAIFADSDHAEGYQVLNEASKRGICTIAITNRPVSPWNFMLRRPVQTRDVLAVLNKIDADHVSAREKEQLQSASVEHNRVLTSANVLAKSRIGPALADAELLRKAGNFYQYLAARGPRKIVDVRFSPGRSIMFNHALGEYCSAILPQQLLQLAQHPVKETAHGDGQANAEWAVARRMLPSRSIEDLTWQVTMQNSEGVALPELSDTLYKMTRLPRLSVPMAGADLSMGKLLTRTPSNVRDLARSANVSLAQAINFCNAALLCNLLQKPAAPSLSFSTILSAAVLKFS
jgi:hypothetical protein